MLTNAQKYLLNLLGSFNQEIGSTQLVKAVFLEHALSQRNPELYSFHKWHYGPYSKEVLEDARLLADLGLVECIEQRGNKLYRARESSNDYINIAELIQKKSHRSLSTFLENLYEAFKVASMKMGAKIEFNQELRQQAKQFLSQ